MTTTLPLFWHLSSASKKERIDASVKLVGSLEQFQAQFNQKVAATNSVSDDEDEDEDARKSDGLDLMNSQDVSYSTRRLIRGLASPRESSRLGFAVALTELLSRIDTVTCSQILNIIIEYTRNQGSMTGQEERDILFSKLFGIMSVIQSGLAVRTKPLATSASSSTAASSEESYEQIISLLVELGEQKSWLRESAWYALSLAANALHESNVPWKDNAVDKTVDVLFASNTAWFTEKVALVLKLQEYYPKRDWKAALSPTFKNPDLLSPVNLPTISRILKESTTDEDGTKDLNNVPSGTWRPQLNFAWDILLEQMLPGPNSTKPATGSFQDFFKVVVDEALFSSTSSPQRKLWGFQVFQKSLKRVTADTMPMLFTKNFMRSWINHLSKKDRHLHKVAQQTAKEVQSFVEGNPQLGFALILQLTGVNGSQQFDKLTKTKTVESILSSLDARGIQDYVDHLLAQVDEPEGNAAEITTTNSRRAWIIEQLGGLIRNGKIPKEDSWVLSILNWLVNHGLFIVKKKSPKKASIPLRTLPNPAFSDELRKSCRTRLLACLSDLGSQTTLIKQGDKATKVTGVASDGEFWIAKVLSTIEMLEEDKKHVQAIADLDEEEVALFTQTRQTLSKLRKVSPSRSDPAKGAELLLIGILLERHCSVEDEDNMDPNALEACIDAISRMLLSDDKKKKKTKDSSDESLDEPVDVLVDTIIGFLEKSTAYMRTVGNHAFALLSGSIKESTIDLIVTQLERRDPSQLLEDEDDEDEDMDDLAVDDEEEAESQSDEESDEEISASESGEEEEDLELRNKIEEALRVNGIEPATGETDSEDEELMDDDQMMAIDEQLAQVFRSRANERKSGKDIDAQREATHFKNRVLDLVDVYLKQQPSNPLALRLITPLIDLVMGSGSDERQLSDKARGILRSRFSKAKEGPTEVDVEQITLVATNLHAHARKAHSSELLSILSLCSVYLIKIFVHLKAEDTVLDIYKDSIADFATRKNSALNSHFFQDFIRRFPAVGWTLREDLIGFCRKSINGYRQCQFLQLFELLISLLPTMPEKNGEAIDFMPRLKQLLLELAEDSCDEKASLNASQMKELFKLAMSALKQTKRISSGSAASIWETKSWKSLQQKLKTSRFKTSTALHKMCEQITRTLEASATEDVTKAPEPVLSKRKADMVNGDDAGTSGTKPSKRKKVKGNK